MAGPSMAAESVLRIGMTAADVPRHIGQPDQGFEGNVSPESQCMTP